MDTNQQDSELEAQKKLAKNLDEAVENCDIIEVRSLLGQGADPNHQLYWSEEWRPWEPPLHWACQWGFLEIVKTLVTHGAHADKGGGWLNRFPLHYACVRGYKEVVEYLIQEVGCSTDVRDDKGWSPLDIVLDPVYLSDHKGCMDLSLYLVSCGCDGDEGKAKLLRTACSPGKLDVVKKVVEQHKVNPKNEYLRDKNGQSPLDLAMDHMHDYDSCMDVALYLKSRGCGGDEDKPRFLCAACRKGRLGVVMELVEQDKVDPRSVRDSWNWTPLHNACYTGRKDIVQYLVEKANCDINATDDIGRTPLNIAIQSNFTEITDYLQLQQSAVTGKSDDSRNEDSDDSRNEDSDDSRNEDNDESRNENSDDSRNEDSDDFRNEGSDPPTTAKTQKALESMS